MEYYLVMKINELELHVATGVNPETKEYIFHASIYINPQTSKPHV